MTNDFNYFFSPCVRARKENFGLLFYNSRDTKLTFVKSGDLFGIQSVPPNRFLLTIDGSDAADKEAKIKRLIKVLLDKRLVVETRIGI